MNWLLDPFRHLDNPKVAAVMSGVQTAVLLAIATFLLNLASALAATQTPPHTFAFDWRLQGYMLGASAIGAVGKALAAYVGAKGASQGASTNG